MGRRLTLGQQVRYAPTDDGAAVLGPSGTLALRGGTVYAWLERLGPFLDGTHDVDAVLATLPDAHRAVAEHLLTVLERRGFLRQAPRDAGPPPPHGLDEDELRRHAHEIAFVGHWYDAPEHRFARFRDARILLAGEGPLHTAAEHALLACGLRRVRGAGPRTPADAWRSLVARCDAVLLTGPMGHEAAAAAACRAAGVPLGHALTTGDAVWLLPPGHPLDPDDVRYRLAGRDTADEGGGGALSAPAAALVGGRLALSVFRLLTGVPDPEEPRADGPAAGRPPEVTRIGLDRLTTTRHRVLPRPAPADAPPDQTADASAESADASAERPFEARLTALRAGPALDPDELTARLAACADERTGPYTAPTLDHGTQIPLTVAHCTVRAPDGGGTRVVGSALDPRAARAEALRRAAARYAADAAPRTGRTLAERLTDGRPSALPAHAVYRGATTHGAAFANRDAPEGGAAPGSARGVACAESWYAAVEAALLDACRELARAGAAHTACPRLEAEPLPADAARHWRLLSVLGPVPEIRDASAGCGAPAVALLAEGEPTVLGCAATAQDALVSATRELLLLRQEPGAAYAPGTPEALRAPAPGVVGPPPPLPGSGPRERVAHLAARLAERGRTAYALPLGHDTAFHALAPYTVLVVVDDGA